MSERTIPVNMGQLAISGDPEDVLIALGLGSCIAVCVYDPIRHVGGMIHVVLPDSAISGPADTPAKFADLGVPRLLEEVQKAGAMRFRMRIALAGGANVLAAMNHGMDIGSRNATAVLTSLSSHGLVPIASDVGGNSSRTVRLRVSTGEITVKTLRAGEAVLAALV